MEYDAYFMWVEYIIMHNTLVTGDRHTVARTLTVLASLLKHRGEKRVGTRRLQNKEHTTQLTFNTVD
jgi:hypothetical protein